MTTTARLELPYIYQSQAQSEVTHNVALNRLDVYVQAYVWSVGGLTSPPGSPNFDERHVVGVGASGAWTGLDNYIVAWTGSTWDSYAPKEGFMVFNWSTNSFWVYYTNTSPNAWAELATGGSSRYLVSSTIDGTPAASQRYVVHPFTESITFPAGLTGSRAYADVTSTGSVAIDVRRRTFAGSESSIGTITFTAGNRWAAFTFASPVTFDDGDVMKVIGPAGTDATLADIGIVLRGEAA